MITKPRPLENNLVRPDGSPAALAEVLRRIAKRVARQSGRGRGVHLSAVEVRALDWAVLRDSSIAGAEERWLLSAAHNRDQSLDQAARSEVRLADGKA